MEFHERINRLGSGDVIDFRKGDEVIRGVEVVELGLTDLTIHYNGNSARINNDQIVGVQVRHLQPAFSDSDKYNILPVVRDRIIELQDNQRMVRGWVVERVYPEREMVLVAPPQDREFETIPTREVHFSNIHKISVV